MWETALADLPAKTLAPTLYGLGPTLGSWAAGVLRMVGDEPCIIVGCSIGGSCALEIARAAPNQVLGLVLVGAKCGVRPEPHARDDAIRLLRDNGLGWGWHTIWQPLFGESAAEATVEQAAAWALEQRVEDIVTGVRAFHDRHDQSRFANEWKRPVVVLSGDQDRTPPAAAACLPGPQRRFYRIDDCGHYANLEQPTSFRALLAAAITWIEAEA